jgi:hypothetical protein
MLINNMYMLYGTPDYVNQGYQAQQQHFIDDTGRNQINLAII